LSRADEKSEPPIADARMHEMQDVFYKGRNFR
jgi:hypothetical protein